MKLRPLRFLFSLLILPLPAAATDTLTLRLQDAIALAGEESAEVQRARNTFLAAYWNYLNFRANRLPSVTLTSSPSINRELNKIVQADGTTRFIRQDQSDIDLALRIEQPVGWTGGKFLVRSSLNRYDEFRQHTVAYGTAPLIIGYEQNLLGYNALKWEKRIEPLRFREAKKQYAESLEVIAATTCSHFFALASAQAELEMARQNFASADTLYRMAQGRYEIGTVTENEMLQLEINRLNEETNVMEAEITLREAAQAIRSFLGLEPESELRLIVPDSVPQFQVPMAAAVETALANSPDPEYYRRTLRESESQLAYAKADRGLRADLYVQFGLSQTGRDFAAAYRRPLHQEAASITLAMPLLDWGRGRGKVRLAKSRLALAQVEAEQGMNDFRQNVEKLVMQFNMQGRKVRIAALTNQRAEKRHNVARRLYIMGRSSLLDLNAAISEKNAARRNHISAIRTYWTLYFTLRSMTAYDFEHHAPITEQLPL